MDEYKNRQLRNGEAVTPLGTFSENTKKDYPLLIEIIIVLIIITGTVIIKSIYTLLK